MRELVFVITIELILSLEKCQENKDHPVRGV